VPWVLLIIAGLLEVVWALSLRSTQGFTRLWPSVLTLSAMALSFWLLARAMRDLSPGVAYAVWVGIGAVGVALLAPWVLKEPLTLRQVACVLVIAAGIVGLKLVTP
jgi:quaternary ammonium compound-resistance protein SugE